MTDLVCTVCNVTVDKCRCPDMDERLRESAYHGDVALKWCPACDKHFARCTCPDPTFIVILNGVAQDVSKLRDSLGRRIDVHLRRR